MVLLQMSGCRLQIEDMPFNLQFAICNLPFPRVAWRLRRRQATRTLRLRAGRAELRGDRVERHVGVRSDRLDGREAHDDDQGQHHGVFHRGGAIFGLQKRFDLIEQLHDETFPIR